jgi:hypothetical protein
MVYAWLLCIHRMLGRRWTRGGIYRTRDGDVIDKPTLAVWSQTAFPTDETVQNTGIANLTIDRLSTFDALCTVADLFEQYTRHPKPAMISGFHRLSRIV